jgi:hypothetical protein
VQEVKDLINTASEAVDPERPDLGTNVSVRHVLIIAC